MKIPATLLLLLLPVFILISCASARPAEYAGIDAGVYRGSYDYVLASMNDEKGPVRKNIYTSKNDILFYLDRGMVHHYAGNFKESSQDLQMAERLIEEAYTKSISSEIGSFLANDNAKDYAGEDYEDLYTNVFGALNYYRQGNLESSLVEIRRLNEKLNFMADKYQRATDKAARSNDKVNTRDLPMEASRFSNSALARYLGMLFFRGIGKNDDARIDYEELLRAYDLAPSVYTRPVPPSVNGELSVPADKARLNIIAFTGLSPVKEQENIIIPLPLPFPNNTAKLALPKMVNRSSDIHTVEVILNSGDKLDLELIEDMGAVAHETFKSKRGLIIVKTTARTITKAVVSAAAAQATAKKQGGLAGLLVGVAGRVATDVSEQADLRLSRYFPSRALVGGINLDPGQYSVTINFYNAHGGRIHSEVRDIDVRKNTLNLEQFFCLK